MTREEENREKEISQAAESEYFVTKAEEFAWIHGAEWADEHPRKELWDAKKVCEILHEIINSDTIVQYLLFDDENIDFDSELFFDDLRKAMEE